MRLIVIVLASFILIISIYIKYTVGNLSDVAAKYEFSAAYSDGTQAVFRRLGLDIVRVQDSDISASSSSDCRIIVMPIGASGERLSLIENYAKAANHLSFLVNGRLVDQYPYRGAMFARFEYMLSRSFFYPFTYQPVVAVFESGKCDKLDPIRAQPRSQ